ncbi:MAG: hypothetical protein ACYTHJ_01830 [Planctomycetota bacterium]|jgi:uncharacterized protein YbjQ (UPF0145 family)
MLEPAAGLAEAELSTQAEQVRQWLEQLGWPALIGIAAMVLAVLAFMLRRLARMFRPKRRPSLHPKLQQYGEPDPELVAKRRAEAERIIATSSTDAIAGYEIVRQIETVFVDGFRKAEDALEGLKATAAMKGANAVSNVRHERGNRGKWTAAGDALVIRPVQAQPLKAPEIDQPRPPSTPVEVYPLNPEELYPKPVVRKPQPADPELIDPERRHLPPPDAGQDGGAITPK